MNVQIFILVCALATPRLDCTPTTAISVSRGPDVQNEIMCGFIGQAYVADTALAGPDSYVKILCRRPSQNGHIG